MHELRRLLVTLYVKCIVYYASMSPKLDEWLCTEAVVCFNVFREQSELIDEYFSFADGSAGTDHGECALCRFGSDVLLGERRGLRYEAECKIIFYLDINFGSDMFIIETQHSIRKIHFYSRFYA